MSSVDSFKQKSERSTEDYKESPAILQSLLRVIKGVVVALEAATGARVTGVGVGWREGERARLG
jgi:hypothetical protein